jgi:hypothetical protein
MEKMAQQNEGTRLEQQPSAKRNKSISKVQVLG